MSYNRSYPNFLRRIGAVWYRHFKVYTRHLVSNGLPPFLEPLIMLAGLGLGLADRIGNMNGSPYIQFLAGGMLISSAMYTAAFECTFGTFIRMDFDHNYDGMLGTPITASDLILGEQLWAGTKGAFFSLAVTLSVMAFGILKPGLVFFVPLVGFLTGLMFGTLSHFVTSFVKNINAFNFFFTGLLSPMFFFTGIIFPISDLPKALQPVAEVLPLTHPVRMARALASGDFSEPKLLGSLIYCFLFILLFGFLSNRRLKKRLID